MAKSNVADGRLVMDGDTDHLRFDDSKVVGERQVMVHDENGEEVLRADGTPIIISVPILKFGPNHWRPVRWSEEDGEHVFISEEDESHNSLHHQSLAVIEGTQTFDPSNERSFAGTPDEPTEGNEHHWGVLERDPHYVEGATHPDRPDEVTNVRTRRLPDRTSAVRTGHTRARSEEEGQ